MVYWSDAPICSTQFVKACLTWHPVCPAEGRYEITNTSELPFELLVGEACYDIAPNSTIRFTMKTPQPMMLKTASPGAIEGSK